MTGILTEAMTEEITVDTKELVEARWFDRGEIRDLVARAAFGDLDPPATVPSTPGAGRHCAPDLPPLGDRYRQRLAAGELALGQSGEEARAERQDSVVEIVSGVVDLAGTRLIAIADADVSAGPPIEHVREIFRGHH
jgi:hypothetical protein